MAHFAKLDENNIVTDVILVANDILLNENNVEEEKLGIDFLIDLTGHTHWKQTSFNTEKNKHINFNRKPLRKNYARIGWIYDEESDAFIEQRPFPSWIFNEVLGTWNPPVPFPEEIDFYVWDEFNLVWVLGEKI